MAWWIYKCNNEGHELQVHYGDWNTFFKEAEEDANSERTWGTTECVSALARLQVGDMIIAYQTDRNELVGVARITRDSSQDTYVYMTPVRKVRALVKPLKDADARIAAIPALKGGWPRTIYEITPEHAELLLEAAGGGVSMHRDDGRQR